MIVAKTRLKRIPKTCGQCSFTCENWGGDKFCRITKKDCPLEIKPSGNVAYGKPSWCPLVDVKDGDG